MNPEDIWNMRLIFRNLLADLYKGETYKCLKIEIKKRKKL